MMSATRLFRNFAVPVISFVLLATHPAAVTENVSSRTNLSVCDREVKKLGPPRWGENIRYPAKLIM
jgi:hypothetical protein